MKKTRIHSTRLLALAGTLVSATAGFAETYTSVPTAGSWAWDNVLNWTPGTGFPDAIGDVANLTSATAGLTAELNGNRTIGTLNLGGAAGTITTLAAGTPAGILIFNPGDGGTANLNLSTGSISEYQSITAPMQIGGQNTTLQINRTATQFSLGLNSAIDVNGNTLVFNLTDTDTASRVELNGVNSNITGTGTVIKQGTGVLGTSRNLTFAGDVAVSDGTFFLRGATGRLSNFNSLSIASTGIMRVGDGSNSAVITPATSRLNPSAGTGIVMNSGRLWYTSGLAAGASVESAPELNIASGAATLDLTLGSVPNNYTLTFAAIDREVGSTLELRSYNALGTAATTLKLADASGLNLIGGGGAINSSTASIVAWMLGRAPGSDPTTAFATEFVTYDAATGFRLANTYQTDINAATAFENVSGVAGGATLSSTKTINALRFGRDYNTTLNLGGNTLTISSGLLALLPSLPVVTTSVTNGTINFGAAEGIINVAGTGTASVSANIQGSGGLTKANTGALILSGNNTYTGPTHISAGVLRVGSATALPTTSAVILSNTKKVQSSGSTLVTTALDLNGFDVTVGSVAGGGTDGGNVLLGANTLTTGGDNTDTEFGGQISGSGNVIKSGTGEWTLTGNNTYSGATTVNAGSLLINGSLASANVTIGAAGLLGGSGVLSGDVQINGTLSPGNSPGTLTLNGDVSFASGSAIALELGSLQDVIVFEGISQTLTSAGPITMAYTLGAGFVAGQAYTIMDWSAATGFDASGFDIADFVGTPSGYTADYEMLGDSLTVTLTVVPEPSALFLGLFAAAGLGLRRRTRGGSCRTADLT
jgi:fibronectin-binding autotransporter adhesin